MYGVAMISCLTLLYLFCVSESLILIYLATEIYILIIIFGYITCLI